MTIIEFLEREKEELEEGALLAHSLDPARCAALGAQYEYEARFVSKLILKAKREEANEQSNQRSVGA